MPPFGCCRYRKLHQRVLQLYLHKNTENESERGYPIIYGLQSLSIVLMVAISDVGPARKYRIIWHISPPYVARAAELRAFWGGLYQRGAYSYANFWAILSQH